MPRSPCATGLRFVIASTTAATNSVRAKKWNPPWMSASAMKMTAPQRPTTTECEHRDARQSKHARGERQSRRDARDPERVPAEWTAQCGRALRVERGPDHLVNDANVCHQRCRAARERAPDGDRFLQLGHVSSRPKAAQSPPHS